MFYLSGIIQFDGIGEKPCAEHHKLSKTRGMQEKESVIDTFRFEAS